MELLSENGPYFDVGPRLLLSASCGYHGDPELVSLLLDMGYSTYAQVQLLSTYGYETERRATVWLTFFAFLSVMVVNNFSKLEVGHAARLFAILEQLARSGDQEEVLVLGSRADDLCDGYLTHYSTLREIVLYRQAPNAREILETIEKNVKPIETDHSVWLEKVSSHRLRATPMLMTEHELRTLQIRAIASRQEGVIFLEDICWQVW